MKETFVRVSEKYSLDWFAELMITASNDINEETILSLNEQVRCPIWLYLDAIDIHELSEQN